MVNIPTFLRNCKFHHHVNVGLKGNNTKGLASRYQHFRQILHTLNKNFFAVYITLSYEIISSSPCIFFSFTTFFPFFLSHVN